VSRQLPEPEQLFTRFHADCTSNGAARDRFEAFVLDLVQARWEDASTVAARNNNDWGIDAFVGNLGGGDIRVWQAKYFREWQNRSPQNEVRGSFASAQKQAQAKGHRIVEWTLVVPAILHPEQRRWFDRWGVKQRRLTGTRIMIWQGDELRRQLISTETFQVRREYFPHTLDADAVPPAERPEVAVSDDYSMFDDALFVRQLRAAGHVETGAACGTFFATDALRRDLQARRADRELQALKTVQLGIHSAWDMRFNELVGAAAVDGLMPALYRAVITDAMVVPDPPGLILQPAHKQGAAHMLVDDGKAGWVSHWREVVASHTGASTPPATDDIDALVDGIEHSEPTIDNDSTVEGAHACSTPTPEKTP